MKQVWRRDFSKCILHAGDVVRLGLLYHSKAGTWIVAFLDSWSMSDLWTFGPPFFLLRDLVNHYDGSEDGEGFLAPVFPHPVLCSCFCSRRGAADSHFATSHYTCSLSLRLASQPDCLWVELLTDPQRQLRCAVVVAEAELS